MAIATIIMTAVVVQQNKWNENLSLRSQAYEVALMIRQAQIYSLGVREDVDNTAADKFNVGYGLYFSLIGSEKIVFFADRDNDKEYDPDEKIEEKKLKGGVKIEEVCRVNLEPSCSHGMTGNTKPKQVSILFLRPDPKAHLSFRSASGVLSTGGPAYLVLSLNGSKAVVKVEDNGQISVIN